MEILQLRYFCEAAECESFTLTAKKYTVPPSDISQSIKRLEMELGAKLFDRSANRIKLNSRGREFLHSIRTALSMIDGAVGVARGESTEKVIRLCVNCNRRIVWSVAERFRHLHGDIEIVFANFRDPLDDDYDIIVERDIEPLAPYKRERLLTERVVLAAHSSHPLAKERSVDISSLGTEAFVAMRGNTSLAALTSELFGAAGVKQRVAIETDDPFYFRRCVEAGLGIAIVPEFSWRGQFSDDVVFVDIGGISCDTYVYTSAGAAARVEVAEFISMLKEACRE